MRIRKTGQDISLFNRQSNSTSSDLTIVCKAKSTSGENIITNRDSNYNWMYRLKTSGQLRFHGNSETGSIAWNTSNPDIMSVRTYYSSGTKLKYNNWTQNTSTSPTSFTYGSTNNDSGTAGALFVGYGWNSTNEQWSGDFYWVYMTQANLTDAQIQEVIDYNEGGGGEPEYPVYYDEMQDPPDNLVFTSMAEAEAYECPWVGMHATIAGDNYIFSGDSQSGYEWVEQSYSKYEYIRTGSGNSYYTIDTGFYPTTANTIEVKFEMVDRSVDWGNIVSWGVLGNTAHSTSLQFATVTTSYQAIVRTGGNNGAAYRPTIGANNSTVYTLPLSATSGTYSVNGGTTNTIRYNINSSFNLPSIVSMRILGGYGNDNGDIKNYKSAVGKLYYVKVYDGNGNIVKHYIPSDNNGTPCFYEIVDGEYIMDTYTGSNHGTLTLGPQV
jgi:hypothetical protein